VYNINNMQEKEYITLEKKELLETELKELVDIKRKEIAAALEYAKSLGDLSENAEYHQAREDQAHLEDRIREIEYILKNAEITERHHSGSVELGATVSVKKKGDKTVRKFLIVGSEEADVQQGKISNESALGKALLGKKEKDEASFHNPKSDLVTYVITNIE
jgi:transcription elongation factor GreA